MSGILPIPVPLRRNFTCDNFLEPCGGLINIVKNELTASQSNGYTVGDTITYEVSVINAGQSSIPGVILYETLEPIDIKYDKLGLFEGSVCLPPGWVTRVIYNYTVTEEDILDRYLTGVVCLSTEAILPTVLLREEGDVLFGETTLSAVFVSEEGDNTHCNDNTGEYTALTGEDDDWLLKRAINLNNGSAHAVCTSKRSNMRQVALASITKTVVNGQSAYVPGDVITYQVTVNSIGGSPLRNVKLEDTLQQDINVITGQDLFTGGVEIQEGTSRTAIYTYTVKQQDLVIGTVSNTVIMTTASIDAEFRDSVIGLPVQLPGELVINKSLRPCSNSAVLPVPEIVSVNSISSTTYGNNYIEFSSFLVESTPYTAVDLLPDLIATGVDLNELHSIKIAGTRGVDYRYTLSGSNDFIVNYDFNTIGEYYLGSKSGKIDRGTNFSYSILNGNDAIKFTSQDSGVYYLSANQLEVIDAGYSGLDTTSFNISSYQELNTFPSPSLVDQFEIEITDIGSFIDDISAVISPVGDVSTQLNFSSSSPTGGSTEFGYSNKLTMTGVAYYKLIDSEDIMYKTDTITSVTEYTNEQFECFTPRARVKSGSIIDDYGRVGDTYFKNNVPCSATTKILTDQEIKVSRIGNRLSVDWEAVSEELCGDPTGFRGDVEFYWIDKKEYTADDELTYDVTVTNIGGRVVNNALLQDTLSPIDIISDDGLFSGTSLAPGESKTATYKYTVTFDDVRSGKIANRAIIDSSAGRKTSNEIVVDSFIQPEFQFNIDTNLGNEDQNVFVTIMNETSTPFAQIKSNYLSLRGYTGMANAPFWVVVPAVGWYGGPTGEIISEDDPRPDSDDLGFWGYPGPFRLPDEFVANPNSNIFKLDKTDSELVDLNEQDLFTMLNLQNKKPGTIVWVYQDPTGYGALDGWERVFLQYHREIYKVFLNKCKAAGLRVIEYEEGNENWVWWHERNAEECQISTNKNQFELPLIETGSYNLIVDWGDGTSNIITSWNQSEKKHTYTIPGKYTIKILGDVNGWSFKDNNRLKFISTDNWNGLNITTPRVFKNCANWTGKATTVGSPTISIADFDRMFERCYSLNGDNLNSWGTEIENVVSMKEAFINCYSFNGRLDNWRTNNVTSLQGMFTKAFNFNQTLNTWNVGSVIYMKDVFKSCRQLNRSFSNWRPYDCITTSGMFFDCTNFNGYLNSWTNSITGVENMSYMFAYCRNFNQPLYGWDVSNVQNFDNTFNECSKFNKTINTWDVSSATNLRSMFNNCTVYNKPMYLWEPSSANTMAGMFYNCVRFNQNLDNWGQYIGNVSDIRSMFKNCDNFNNGEGIGLSSAPLSSWNVSGCQNFSEMFRSAVNFNQPIDNWQPSNADNMSSMFRDASVFNQSLDPWGSFLSNVTLTNGMFRGATKFNQPLNSWNISNVTNMSEMFRSAQNFNQPLNSWVPSSVNNTSTMFNGAWVFNQDISSWGSHLGNVSNMQGMFADARVFNNGEGAGLSSAPLNSWIVSSVTNMKDLFYNARSFNQPIDQWDMSSVTTINNMFRSAVSFNQPIDNWASSSLTSLTNMERTFQQASSFNQPLNSWGPQLSSVTNMNETFRTSSAFNQPLNTWDIRNVNILKNFLNGATSMSNQNYSDTLVSWAQLPVQLNVEMHASSKRLNNTAVTDAYNTLVSNYSWTINDQGIEI